MSDFLYSVFAVEAHADGLIGFNELVELLSKVLVLQLEDSNVIVEGVDLSLQVRILVEQWWIIISGVFEIFSELHNLFFSDSDLGIIFLNKSCEFSISDALLIDSSLYVSIFRAVSLVKGSEMLKFLLVTCLLGSEFDQFTLSIN